MPREDVVDTAIVEALDRRRGEISSQVSELARRSGRAADEVRIVAVTKSVDAETALVLARSGCNDLGEARIDELERKRDHFLAAGQPVTWHFIGHLQRNKARRVVRAADQIHSVDSLRLLEHIARIAQEEERRPGIFLQVKLSDEVEKAGLAPEDVETAVRRARELAPAVLPLGLMTMAPRPSPSTSPSTTFKALAALAETLSEDLFAGASPKLSMGMSGDFPEAIAAGANVVRIGSAFFDGIEVGSNAVRRSG